MAISSLALAWFNFIIFISITIYFNVQHFSNSFVFIEIVLYRLNKGLDWIASTCSLFQSVIKPMAQ